MALPGLQGYQGDSEISDSEGDVSPEHESAPVPDSVISNIGLGIPRSQPPVRPSPPPFTKPVVRSAPSITLVNYDRDEDDDMDMSMEQEPNPGLIESRVILVTKPTQRGSISPISAPQSPPHDSPMSSSSDDEGDALFIQLDGVELPPAPEGVCSQALQNKLNVLLGTKRRLGITPFDQIKKGKAFRNPSIYEKLIEVCGINEFGTNYSKDIYDPHEWTDEDYYDKLAEAQKKAHEMKQRARAERSKIEFKSGTKQTSSIGILPNPSQEAQKRKSKWDMSQVAAVGGSKSTGSSPIKRTGNLPVGAQALINARVISKSDMMKLINK